VCVCMFQHKSGKPGAISTKLGTYMTISIYIKMDVCFVCIYIYTDKYKNYVCVCVCMCI
jgi:hypothetical protein